LQEQAMPQELSDDWNPLDVDTLKDQRKTCDSMREQCPVAHSSFLGWSVFRHEDVSAILADPDTFINVSKFPAIPNGMNPPEHTVWYSALAPFFNQVSMARLEPRIRQLVRQLIALQHESGEAEFVSVLVTPYVFKSLCALLGWPEGQWKELAAWVQANQELALKPDALAGKELADSFAALVEGNLEMSRTVAARTGRASTECSASDGLLQVQVNGQRLSDETITTVLRNWVAGHGTTAEALGMVVMHMAGDAQLQQQLRQTPALIPAAIEEILRMDGPLVANRRTTTREVELQGCIIPENSNLSLMWIAANRDPRAFVNASACLPDRDTSASLVWGQGIHLCMGAPLARLEMRVALEELLANFALIELVDREPPRKVYPGNGYAALRLRFS